MGWVPNIRHGNHGGIGNTLEQLLGIKENNLPIPNAAEWELKAQRIDSSSLTTLFHMEPSPRAMRFVPQILLPTYGWAHQQAGVSAGPGRHPGGRARPRVGSFVARRVVGTEKPVHRAQPHGDPA